MPLFEMKVCTCDLEPDFRAQDDDWERDPDKRFKVLDAESTTVALCPTMVYAELVAKALSNMADPLFHVCLIHNAENLG